MKARFINLLRQVDRNGTENLLSFLEESDFYRAPASTQHHGAVEGGLLGHSLAVYDHLDNLLNLWSFDTSTDSAAIVALLHDVCKANFYTVELRNKKDHTTADGVYHPGWGSYPFYAIDDQMPLGHGSKSVIILQQFIALTTEEIMAINHHMGAWHAVEYSERQALNSAMDKYPLVLALQTADLMATYYDKK